VGAESFIYYAIIILYGVATLILMSAGLSIIFGVMGVINFAHGEFLMIGAYTVLVSVNAGLNLWVAMVIAPIVVGLIGLIMERMVIRYLYGRLIDTILATWGFSILFVQLVVFLFGPATKGIGTPFGSITIGAYSISKYTFLIIGVTIALVLVVYLIFSKTRYGVEAQATAQLPQMASALGVNAERTMMVTFCLGSALSGAAGALLAPTVGVIPNMGVAFIARSFMCVITGGQALLSGLAVAAGALGSAQHIVSVLTQPFLGQGALLMVAIILLRIMPQGLSGKWRRQL
jgi:branched-subunit amino acid ABC-type transport system permease component